MIKQRISAWLKNDFLQNVLVLFSGSAIAQAIPVLSMLILTRIYPEEIFGIFFIYASAGIILYILSTLKLEIAIVLPETDEEAMQIFNISVLISFLISILAFIVVYVMFDFLGKIFSNKNIGPWLYLLPVSMLFRGIFQSCVFWYNRKKQYRQISIGRIAKAVTMACVQIFAGVIGYIKGGLIVGLVAGQFVSAFYMLIFIKIKNSKLTTNFGNIDLKKHLSTYLKIPVFNTIMGVLNNLSNQLPVFLLSRYFGLQIVGFYGLANRIVSTPMGLVGQSVGQVFYQQAAQAVYTPGALKYLVRNTYVKLSKFAIIPFIILFIFSPTIFKVFFGEAWITTGVYTRILIPWLFLMFLNAPITYITTILKKQHIIVVYEILLLACRFLALYAGYTIFNSVIMSIVLFSSVGLIFNLFLLLYHLSISSKTCICYETDHV